ncbi:MAG: YjcQ family protein [Atopobiaceae bacterium]|jgi:hypothetical protein|nr:YjcQ family protein [Atopobiaceae bacterium]MCI2174051.1 YjcQ family protein [Atopobiaceae bacterium]MCI2207859.1 YjcQ family protein [Atopobiaceae bacterium]
MSDFRTIYRILHLLESSMDYDDGCDPERLTAETLGISQNRLDAIWAMLSDEGYVSGVTVREYLDRQRKTVMVHHPAITLKGLEYLQENSMMRKDAELAVGIVGAVS